MKNLIKQFYNEGLATTFIKRPQRFINKSIKSKSIKNILNTIIYIFYTLFVLSFAGLYLYYKLK